MGITPLQTTLAAGGVAALASGIAEDKLIEGIVGGNPTGSGADVPGTAIPLLVGLGGAALGVYGMIKGGGKSSTMASAALGAGIGLALGSTGAHIAFRVKHGVGIDTKTNDIFSSYNRDWDNVLDLRPNWRTPEFVRREESTYEDSNHHQHTTVHYYSISDLAFAADGDHNNQVTRDELRSVMNRFDSNHDQRLQGSEARAFNRQYGEQYWGGGWVN